MCVCVCQTSAAAAAQQRSSHMNLAAVTLLRCLGVLRPLLLQSAHATTAAVCAAGAAGTLRQEQCWTLDATT